MSSPISSFEKLSLSQEMESSCGHTRGQSGEIIGKGKEPAPSDDERDSGSDNESDYSWSEHAITLDHCRQHCAKDTDRNYYAFQIAYAEVGRYSIRISPTDSGIPTCSCDEEEPCRHITWLLEQLGPTKEGFVKGIEPDVYQHISDMGLKNVCEDLNWDFREGPGSDSDWEESKWQLKKDYHASKIGRQAREMIKARMSVVRDMMAALSPNSRILIDRTYSKDRTSSLWATYWWRGT